MNEMNKANRRYWDAMAPGWQELRDQDQLWRKCPQQPELAFDGEALAMIGQLVGDLPSKLACVVSSGDNYVAFALAGMGAHVTSTDISAQQLEVARQRADLLGLEIAFVRADAAALESLAEGQFDLVCSSNGFFVWIAEPGRVFQQVCRVLRPGGFYIFYDWRISDLINPLLDAGLVLRRLAESPAQDVRFWEGFSYAPGVDQRLLDFRSNPRAGLPAWLTVAAQKPG